jgi:hypothetical protein
MDGWKIVTIFSSALALFVFQCGGAAPPAAPQAGPPSTSAALAELATARQYLDLATPDRGGHREQALHLVDRAVWEIDQTVDAASMGQLEPPKFDPGKPSYLETARTHLQTALDDLQRARPDNQGHRERAMEACGNAIHEIDKGISHIE